MRAKTKVLMYEIGTTLLGLIGVLSGRRLQHQYGEVPKPEPFSLRKAVSGAVFAAVFTFVDDRDVGGVRRSRTRRILFVLCWNALLRRLDPEFDWSFSFGSVLGSFCYRIWFGIVRPIPEPRLKYRGWLRRS